MFVSEIPIPHSQGQVVWSKCCSIFTLLFGKKNGWKFQHHPNLWMNEWNLQLDEKREKRKEKPKLVPELPGHFRTLRSYRPPRLGIERERERERDVWERWHPDSHRHRKLPRSSFAFWGWRAWLGPNTFCLTKNLLFFSHLKLTYLLAHKVSTVTLGRWRSHGRHPTSTVTAPTSELLRKGFIWLLLRGLVTTKKDQAKQRKNFTRYQSFDRTKRRKKNPQPRFYLACRLLWV